jgi:hypothetical protein
MLYELQIILMSSAMSGLFAFIVGKLVIKTEKQGIKDEVLDYINSQEAIESMATMGAAFGHGLMTQFKIGNVGKQRYVKLFGFKIPQSVVDALVAKLAAKYITPSGQPTGEGISFG